MGGAEGKGGRRDEGRGRGVDFHLLYILEAICRGCKYIYI